MLCGIDDFTREALAILVKRRLNAMDAPRGRPTPSARCSAGAHAPISTRDSSPGRMNAEGQSKGSRVRLRAGRSNHVRSHSLSEARPAAGGQMH
jgi:hypothetical protein